MALIQSDALIAAVDAFEAMYDGRNTVTAVMTAITTYLDALPEQVMTEDQFLAMTNAVAAQIRQRNAVRLFARDNGDPT